MLLCPFALAASGGGVGHGLVVIEPVKTFADTHLQRGRIIQAAPVLRVVVFDGFGADHAKSRVRLDALAMVRPEVGDIKCRVVCLPYADM